MERSRSHHRLTWTLILVGSGLLLATYLLGYGWCRRQHILVHYYSDKVHTISTGDGGIVSRWFYRVPYAVFTPLRWMEVIWWQSRG